MILLSTKCTIDIPHTQFRLVIAAPVHADERFEIFVYRRSAVR